MSGFSHFFLSRLTLRSRNHLPVLPRLLFAVFAAFSTMAGVAHPGNTASDGCHYCRTNCDRWGVPWYERHCHNGYAVDHLLQVSITNDISDVKEDRASTNNQNGSESHSMPIESDAPLTAPKTRAAKD